MNAKTIKRDTLKSWCRAYKKKFNISPSDDMEISVRRERDHQTSLRLKRLGAALGFLSRD
jgi:hypothetical protein